MNKGAIPLEARLEIKYTAPETEYHRLFHWVKHHTHGFLSIIQIELLIIFILTLKITVHFGKRYRALALELRFDTGGTESLFFQRKEFWNLKTVKISTHGRIAISFP